MAEADAPLARTAPPRRWSQQLIWLVPAIAALIGGWLAVQAVLERGPTITIRFATAEGLEPGKTKLKYRDVDIGELKSVSFTPDRRQVVATLELTRQSEPLLVEDTRFWVVRPRIAGGQVSGLGTLLSGAYIGVDAGKSGKARREFIGLDAPPVVTADLPGRLVALRAEDLGSLDIGSPVYLRRVKVGQVVAYELAPDGASVAVTIFVNSPFERHVAGATRFWHASGIDVALDAAGVRVATVSVATLLLGGIAFETPTGSGPSGPPRPEYRLFADRERALKLPDVAEERFMLVFKESVRGLSPGAPVDFRGVVIGEVVSINVDSDPVTPEVRLPVEVRLYPGRLHGRYGRPDGAGDRNYDRLIERMVARGLRAQLRTGSLLTGQLYVALDFFPRAPRAAFDPKRRPREIPTTPGSLTELQDVLAEIARKLERLPLEAMADDVRRAARALEGTLKNADGSLRAAERLIGRIDAELAPEARVALGELRQTLEGARRAFAADAPVPQDLRLALRELTRAAEAMRALADYLERNPESLIRGRPEERR